MKLDVQSAAGHVKAWLGQGLFTPDDLLSQIQHLQLRPAYYSGWVFDGALELRWACEVKESSGRDTAWTPRSGSEARFFGDVLVSGVRALGQEALEAPGSFNL